MTMKGGEPSLTVAGEFDGGLSWIAYPEERMRRASHLLEVDDGVWAVDPVDVDGLEELIAERGGLEGVVVLLDRHKRDSAALATRHDVPVYVPETMEGVVDALDAPTERFGRELGDTGYEARPLHDNRFWQETALFDPEAGTLVVPESVGTASYFLAPGERLGVHPMLRTVPPRRQLGDFSPERVLVGHGEPVLDRASQALADALSGSRRRTPRLYASTLRSMLPIP